MVGWTSTLQLRWDNCVATMMLFGKRSRMDTGNLDSSESLFLLCLRPQGD
jgi:hypothetical protein